MNYCLLECLCNAFGEEIEGFDSDSFLMYFIFI